MRFLHTGDWHVGKRLRGRSRDREVELALDQLVELTRDERIDVVLIAGDIWESQVTSPDSDMIVFDALARLRATGATVVAIPGNHDSSPRLEALGRLLTPLGIVTVPRVMRPSDGGVVEVASRDGSERALIAAVPFVPERRFGDAASLFDDRATLFNQYDEGMGTVMAGMAGAFLPDRVNVLMGHLMIHGAKTGGGERELTIGMTYAVSPSRLPATANYVALGHLHRPQAILGAPGPARFAGSLLQLDFAEAGHKKSVVIVDVVAGKPANVTIAPITAGRALLTVRGPFDELARLGEKAGDAYLQVLVETDGPVPGIADRVRELLPNAVDIQVVYERDEGPAEPGGGVRSLSPREQFLHYFRHAHGADPETALVAAFDHVYDEVGEEVTFA
jgi:exonuclease SbcD